MSQRQNDSMCLAVFVSLNVVCKWMLEGESEASFSLNFKPSMDENKFSYFITTLNFNRDASGVTCRKLQTMCNKTIMKFDFCDVKSNQGLC